MLTISLIATLILLMNATCNVDEELATTILMDAEYLAETKMRIKKNDPKLKFAFDQLIEEADRALQEVPYAVTDKEKLPPSGDQHDYASYSRYWWPDPNQPDGLPYIRRDGETYPGSQSPKESDRPRIGNFGINTETLGLAYYLTQEQKYAKKAAELLRVWFIDEATRMNPNLNHAQCRPGHNNGYKSGVLDGRLMIPALEGSLLIAGSTALIDTEYKSLKLWVKAYFTWLTTNEMALQEAKSTNNHGSYYDAQAIYFALYAGNRKAAKQIAQQFTQNRIFSQIEADGSMPKEIARTRPLFYSIYNLQALFFVAHLSEQVEVDVWKANDPNSSIRAALDYLAPYTDPKTQWQQPTIGEADRMEMFPILQMAHRIYLDGNYLTLTGHLPLAQRQIHRANLAFPLMR